MKTSALSRKYASYARTHSHKSQKNTDTHGHACTRAGEQRAHEYSKVYYFARAQTGMGARKRTHTHKHTHRHTHCTAVLQF